MADRDGESSHDDDAASEDREDKQGGKPERKPSKLPLIILGVVVVILIIAGVWYYFDTRNIETTDDAQVDGNSVTIAPKVSGYVVDLAVTDNQRVKAGQVLAKIDARDYEVARQQARASLALATAQLENAQVNLEQVKVSAPAHLIQAEAQRDSAKANKELADANLRRQRGVDKRATTEENIDSAATQAKANAATLAYNQAQVDIARLVPETIAQAQAQVDQWAAQVEQAKAQVAQAELNLGYTVITAPQDGWVTRRSVQLGSYLTAGQSVFSLVTPAVWITANFKESQLDRMRVGQHVRIEVDAYRHLTLDGHIDSIQMGTGSRFSAFPAENATGNFVKIVQRVPVKIVIDRGLDPNLPLPLGLSVDPEVDLE